jgi:type I restriction enzyme S subunit
MSEQLPQGWVIASLGEVAGINPRHSKGLDDTMPVTFVPMAGLSEAKPTFQFTEERPLGEVRKGFTHFAEGDVLFAKITPCMENGKGAVARGLRNHLGCGTTELHVIRPLGRISPEYIYRFLAQDQVRRAARKNFTGTAGQARVPTSFIEDLEIPLPPLAEQRRIVAKLEQLLAMVDACQQRLAKIPVLLKRFRQAVLAAACSGRLTGEWRGRHCKLESGEALLSRIKESRLKAARGTREEQQIAEAFASRNLSIAGSELGFEDLPDSWAACGMGAVGTVANGSTPSRKHVEYWDGTIPWVSSGEVRNNDITETRERITQAGYENCCVRLLPPGTVLVAMIGEGRTRGQTAVLRTQATINQNIAAIVLDHGLVRSEFLWRWLQFRYEATRERGSGSGPQALNCQRVRELPFVLPPLPEQHEIVRRVDALFALADRIEARFEQARQRVGRLTPAILARAFRGELVSQDPDEEPASVLLERVARERMNHAAKSVCQKEPRP